MVAHASVVHPVASVVLPAAKQGMHRRSRFSWQSGNELKFMRTGVSTGCSPDNDYWHCIIWHRQSLEISWQLINAQGM